MNQTHKTWLNTIEKWDELLSDMRIVEYDCQTLDSLMVNYLLPDLRNLGERVRGRVIYSEIVDQDTGTILIKDDELICTRKAEIIEKSSSDRVRIRSPLTCQSKGGVCAVCFGMDPDSDPDSPELVAVGKLIGLSVIAALRKPKLVPVWRICSFEIGEVPDYIYSKSDGIVKFGPLPEAMNFEPLRDRINSRFAQKLSSSSVSMDQERFVLTIEPQGKKYCLLPEAFIFVNDGDHVSKGPCYFVEGQVISGSVFLKILPQ